MDAAVAFLASAQQEHGEFATFRARDGAIAREREYDSAPLSTTYVLHSLSYVDHPRVHELAAPALDFLEAEMESHGVWRHWTSRHPLHDAMPPDLDDTCCASAALVRFGRQRPPNHGLIVANRDRRGLFYTWLVPRPARARRSRAYWSVTLRQLPITRQRLYFWGCTEASPSDVDCVVNANVLHYLGDRHEARPVVELLRQVLRDGRVGCWDKWHRNACTFYYAVSRAYANGVKSLESLREPLRVEIESKLANAEKLASAELALAMCALFNLGHRSANIDTALARITAMQQDDGAWPAFALYWGGPPSRCTGCWGSRALTTSLCIEAIARSMRSQ
jgi:hypothetical protein